MPARYPRSLSAAGLMTAILLNSALARSAPKDAEALALSKKAINTDYLGMKFAEAEKRLTQAIKICEPKDACSDKVRAQLHADLGAVYFGGMNKPDEAKAQFAAALKDDSSVTLNADLASPEMEAAFAEAKSQAPAAPAKEGDADADAGAAAPEDTADTGKAANPPPKVAAPVAPPPSTPPGPPPSAEGADCPPDFPGCHKKESTDCTGDDCPDKPKPKKNWVTLEVQQDLLMFGSAKGVCDGADPAWVCLYTNGTPITSRPYAAQSANESVGNEVSGGFGFATTRILVGYDRVVGPMTLGVRLGYAFNGSPKVDGQNPPVPFHGEARVAYWFGSDPFIRLGFRPYVVLAGGVAQVDGMIGVKVYMSPSAHQAGPTQATPLNAWSRAGTQFIGGGLGTMFAISQRHGPLVEVKFVEMLGQSAPSLNMKLGYAVGF